MAVTKSTWVPAFAGMTRQGTAFAGDYSLRIRARRAQSRSIAPYATQAILLSQIQPQAVIRPNCCVDARRADQRAEATDYCRGVPVDSRLRTRRRRGASRDGSWRYVKSIAYFGALENQIASSHKTLLAMTMDIDAQSLACKPAFSGWPMAMRLPILALPGSRRNNPRGSTNKNVGCNPIAPIKLIIRRNVPRPPGIDCAIRAHLADS